MGGRRWGRRWALVRWIAVVAAAVAGFAFAAPVLATRNAAPAASLTVTRARGAAPLSVGARTSARTVADASFAGFGFDFGDRPIVVGPQAGAPAGHAYASAVAVRGADGGGGSSTATSEVTVTDGIVGNASFESGTAGWNVSGSGAGVTLAQVSGGNSGAWAAELSNAGTAPSTCVLNDAPNWVATTGNGSYAASLWVRSDGVGVGATLKLKLREYRKDSGALVGTASSVITLTREWQQVSVGYAPLAAGASTLDYSAYVVNAAAGTCFDADDAAIMFHRAPVASLSVAPTAGVAPLVVRADASASTASDLPLASYSFDFGDGSPVVGPQAAATAEHSYAAAGTYTVTVTVSDSGGGLSVARGQVTVSAGIVSNPSFESGMSGWNTSGSSAGVTLTQIAGGYSGAWAAQLTPPAGTAGITCVLNDAPNWVATTASGRYTASLWVRGDGTPDRTLKLKLREYRKDNGALVGEASSAIVLTTAWQQVSVGYTPLAPGASTLDYSAYVASAGASSSFYADDAALAFEPGPAAALTVTPATGAAPLPVHADASASRGADLPIASYSFDFGDGTALVGPQTQATADHTYTFGGTYTVSLTVIDTAGRSSTATRQVTTTTADIVTDSSFESGTSGWNASPSSPGVTLTRVAGGHSGTSAARLTNTGTSEGLCVLNDHPDWVAQTAAGLYTASLWVRSDTPGATLTLRVADTAPNATATSATSAITLTSAWQQVSVSYSPRNPGGGTLNLWAWTLSTPGTCFEADDAAIVFSPGPAASLTVTPATGVAPLVVRADASASTATERPIASYSFNFGDGSRVVGPQTQATAEHSYVEGRSYLITVMVTDTGGAMSIAQSQVTVAAGIVANPSFTTDTSGWNTSGSGTGVTLTQLFPGGYSGDRGAQLANGGTAAAPCVLNDAPNWVATTAAGTYTGSLWVRSSTRGATLKLTLGEYRKDTAALVGAANGAVVLTTAWQQLSVRYTPLAPGASTLDYTASVANAAAGSICFYADDAAIAFQPAPAAAG